MKMDRCLCRLIPRGVFNASVEEESGGASSTSLKFRRFEVK